jgi:hypothetical protein
MKPKETDPQDPAKTGETSPNGGDPSATPPNGGGSATPSADGNKSGDELVTIKRSDLTNLVAARDGNGERLTQLESFAAPIAVRNAIDEFLKIPENAKAYPDLTADDLMHVGSPEDLPAAAKRLQTRFSEHTQNKLMEIQNPQLPTMSLEERQQREADLKKNQPKDGFEQMVAGRWSAAGSQR